MGIATDDWDASFHADMARQQLLEKTLLLCSAITQYASVIIGYVETRDCPDYQTVCNLLTVIWTNRLDSFADEIQEHPQLIEPASRLRALVDRLWNEFMLDEVNAKLLTSEACHKNDVIAERPPTVVKNDVRFACVVDEDDDALCPIHVLVECFFTPSNKPCRIPRNGKPCRPTREKRKVFPFEDVMGFLPIEEETKTSALQLLFDVLRFELDAKVSKACGIQNTVMTSNNSHGADAFVPTPIQEAILKALDGRGMKKQALADIVCNGHGSRLYRSGGIGELKSREMVLNKRGVGYYRPDRPPSR